MNLLLRYKKEGVGENLSCILPKKKKRNFILQEVRLKNLGKEARRGEEF